MAIEARAPAQRPRAQLLDNLTADASVDAMTVRKSARADYHMKARMRGGRAR